MSYSRAHPSPRYLELRSLYRTMHEQGEPLRGIPPEKTFSGKSLAPQAANIKRIIFYRISKDKCCSWVAANGENP